MNYSGAGRGHPRQPYYRVSHPEWETVMRADGKSNTYYADDRAYHQYLGHTKYYSPYLPEKLIQLIEELENLTSRYLSEIDALKCERDVDKNEPQVSNARFEGAVLQVSENKWKSLLDEKNDYIDKLMKKVMALQNDYESMEEETKLLEKSLKAKNKELEKIQQDNSRCKTKLMDLENEMVNTHRKVEIKRIEEVTRNMSAARVVIDQIRSNNQIELNEKNKEIKKVFQDLLKVQEECSNEIEKVKCIMNEKAEWCRSWYEEAMKSKNPDASEFIKQMHREFKNEADQHNKRLKEARKLERLSKERFLSAIDCPMAHML